MKIPLEDENGELMGYVWEAGALWKWELEGHGLEAGVAASQDEAAQRAGEAWLAREARDAGLDVE